MKPDVGSTSAPALHPDLGPGAGQARDDALGAEARADTNVHELPPAAPVLVDVPVPELVGDLDDLSAEQIAERLRSPR